MPLRSLAGIWKRRGSDMPSLNEATEGCIAGTYPGVREDCAVTNHGENPCDCPCHAAPARPVTPTEAQGDVDDG